MAIDHIRYDILTQDALRGLLRRVLADAAKHGLLGDHHFSITFDTTAEGVKLSQRLREQYPQEMTIILQHQFWDLNVGEKDFSVGLSFGGVRERLTVPFLAIKRFFDPAVEFGVQFETLTESEEEETESKLAERPSAEAPLPAPAERDDKPARDTDERPSGEVVRLDRFRKK